MSAPDVLSLEGVSSFQVHCPVQSVLGLIFAISDLLARDGGSASAATMAVVGKNVWVLRLLARKATSTDFDVEVTRLDARDGQVKIEDVTWDSAYRLSVEWDPDARLIRAISVALPIVGRVKVQLVKYDRK